MSEQYDEYLRQHTAGVQAAYMWICDNLPELVRDLMPEDAGFLYTHDLSKHSQHEYEAYDNYFYGNRSFEVTKNFNEAWLHHIHNNPHHWQHWILYEDDPESERPYRCLDMDYPYIIEMICDWWSFGFNSGNLDEIFDWYEKHRKMMKLSENTRDIVDDILRKIRIKLDEKRGRVII